MDSRRGMMGRNRIALMVVFALVLAGLVAIRPSPSVAAGPTIVAQNFSFVGPNGNGDVTIPVGTTVTWTNGGGTHTTTSDAATPLWDAPLGAGQMFMFTFNQVGTFPYHCRFHGGPGTGMHGTITVVSGPAPPPTPTGLHVTGATNNSVSYAWSESDATANIEAYDGSFHTLAPGTTTFTTSGIAYGSYGCLTVAAFNGSGTSAYTPYACSQVVPITPYMPHYVPGSATTSTVSFAWSNYDALSYIGAFDGATFHTLGVNATGYTATAVFAGYYACIAVVAYNGTYASPYSPYACGFALPAAPSGVHTTGHTATSVSFAWANQDPYSGIVLTNDGVHLLNEGINAGSYTQTGMTAGQFSCISIAAYNSSGASGYTAYVCGQAG